MPRGGFRPNSGRHYKAQTVAQQRFAASILDDELERAMWVEMLNATRKTYVEGLPEPLEEPDYKIRLDALKYLSDQKHGKAAQRIEVNGDPETELEFGGVPISKGFESRGTDKPN